MSIAISLPVSDGLQPETVKSITKKLLLIFERRPIRAIMIAKSWGWKNTVQLLQQRWDQQ